MSDRQRDTELSVVEGLWWTLSDQHLIRDVVMKGKYLSNSIKFIANRSQISIEKSKELFFIEVRQFVNNLITNKQLHRASHVLNNVQLNEFYYLYEFYQEEEDEGIRILVFERLKNLEQLSEDDEKTLKANYLFFKLLVNNFSKHSKYLENVNRSTGLSAVTEDNIDKIIFGTFLKQPLEWRNELATDVFFKSKNVHLRHVLDKNCFFAYILRNELYAILKQWLQEAYWVREGNMMRSTIQEPETFEGALLSCFREWPIEQKMMNIVARREKDVIKNDFAKLGLFEARENKSICRKLNRFFTTQTFRENFPTLKTDEITKFVIENKLLDLLPEKFIDYRYIELLLENVEVIYMKEELKLILKLKNLLLPETKASEFLDIMNVTSNYIEKFDTNFDRNRPDLKFINLTLNGLPADDFKEVSDLNQFTRNLMLKINAVQEEEMPMLEELVEKYLHVNFTYIQDEFGLDENGDHNISIDDKKISNTYGEVVKLTYVDYVRHYQGAYGTYLLIRDTLRNFNILSRTHILIGCEEVAKLAIESPEDRELVSNVICFLEMFSVDSRNLRCYLRLLKLKPSNKSFETFVNESIDVRTTDDDLVTDKEMTNVEALEVYWTVKKIEDPPRNYLNSFIVSNDWFHLILLAQYLNIPLKSFISICLGRIKHKPLRDNLIRAILFDSSPESKKRCSFSKRRRAKNVQKPEETKLFAKGKFLDIKHDLFAIIMKCDETTERFEVKFEDFQRMMLSKEITDDLLSYAKLYDWPVIAVIAATTQLYRKKFCWVTWLLLSSDYNWSRKYESITDLAQEVFLHCIRIGFLRTLDESMSVFYPDSAMKILTAFMVRSKNGADMEEMKLTLKQLIIKLSDENYKMLLVNGNVDTINFIIRCVIVNLQANFPMALSQQKYLEAVCLSEVFPNEKVDFVFFKKMRKILEHTNVQINYEHLAWLDKNKLSEAISTICVTLIDEHHFEEAIELSNLLNLPKADFVYKWWIHLWNCEDKRSPTFETKKYSKLISEYHLSIDVLIRFLNTVIKDLEPCVKKLLMMKFVLRNNWIENPIEMDALEYDTILLYLKLTVEGSHDDKLKPLMSEYFESVISKESLIHNSLFELKAIAKIDELTVSQKCLTDESLLKALDELFAYLLDAGDVVQAMRIQEMFGTAPEDLKLLVYVMSIAEGINSIYDISKEERKMISSFGLFSNKFNRLTLRSIRANSETDSISSSPSSAPSENLEEYSSRNNYKENKETFQALQGLACKMKNGVRIAQRIALIYRASLFLNRNFVELMMIKNSFELLELIASIDCENKLMIMSDIMEANQMTNSDIADFIAKEIAACIIRTRYIQFSKDTSQVMNQSTSSSAKSGYDQIDDIWGFSLSKDLHLILELCTSTATLGNHLLKYYKILSQTGVDIPLHSDNDELDRICQHLNRVLSPQMMSLKKKNIIRVELLIIAHECYCNECSTEGIGTILQIAKSLVTELASRKNFTLIVKLMCGIGRYREMSYCFEILIKNEQFEALLGQFPDKQTSSLKTSILSFLNEYHPNNQEYYKMAANHFLMYTELANIWRRESFDKINVLLNASQVKLSKTGKMVSNHQIEVPYLKCSKLSIDALHEILNGMIHATEMVVMDNKIDMSIKFSSFCELIAMQIHLMKVGLEREAKLCPCVINQEQFLEKFQYFANYELLVPQTIILMKNTEVKVDFAKAIFVHILSEDESYLTDYIGHLELTDEIIENVVKISQFDKISVKQEKILNDLVKMTSDKGLMYRLASVLGLKGLLQQMLNDQGTYYYLLDSKYGTVDIF